MSGSGRRKLIFLIAGALVVCAILIIVHVVTTWKYESYTVKYTDSNENVNAYAYYPFGGNILKTASDLTSCVNDRNETIWTDRYDMTDPSAVFCGGWCAVYDKNGNTVRIYDNTGLKNSISTTVPIVNVCVSDTGGAAILTDDGSDVWIDYYDNDGDLVSTIKNEVSQNGYPVSTALSYDGVVLAVSYVSIYNGEYFSDVVFYNFGSEGKGKANNIVSQYRYENELAAAVRYFENGTCAAFTDTGFYLYKGRQVPAEERFVEARGQMLSAFVSDDDIGIIADDSEKNVDVMSIYNTEGKETLAKELDFSYTDVYMNDEQIVLSGVGQLCVLRKNGSFKYNGSLDAIIKDLVPLRNNRFVVLAEGSFKLITLG